MTNGEVTGDDHPETFSLVLGEVADAFDGSGIPYVIIGSVASTYYGRPGSNGDLDVLVRPQEAKRALEALGQSQFQTDEFEPAWIFQATKHGILVDLIFRAHGNIYLDDAMLEHAVRTRIAGHIAPLISPEDALVIEVVSNDVKTPGHWFNALGIVTATELDWAYLRQRARHSSRRVLSLLIYADACDVPIPVDALAAMRDEAYPRGSDPGPEGGSATLRSLFQTDAS